MCQPQLECLWAPIPLALSTSCRALDMWDVIAFRFAHYKCQATCLGRGKLRTREQQRANKPTPHPSYLGHPGKKVPRVNSANKHCVVGRGCNAWRAGRIQKRDVAIPCNAAWNKKMGSDPEHTTLMSTTSTLSKHTIHAQSRHSGSEEKHTVGTYSQGGG